MPPARSRSSRSRSRSSAPAPPRRSPSRAGRPRLRRRPGATGLPDGLRELDQPRALGRDDRRQRLRRQARPHPRRRLPRPRDGHDRPQGAGRLRDEPVLRRQRERRQLGGRPRDRLPADDARGEVPDLRQHQPADLDRARGDLGAAWLRRRARGGTRQRLVRRLHDLRRAERAPRPEGGHRLAERPRQGVHVAHRLRRGHRLLDDRQGRHDRHVVQRHAADRRRLHGRRRARGDRADLGDQLLVRLLPRERRRARPRRLPGRGPRRARGVHLHAPRRHAGGDGGPPAGLPARARGHRRQAGSRHRRLQPVLGRPELHEQHRQGEGRVARRPRQQRLERDDEARRHVLRGGQGPRCAAPALLAPGRTRRLASPDAAEPLVHEVPVGHRQRRPEHAEGAARPRAGRVSDADVRGGRPAERDQPQSRRLEPVHRRADACRSSS